MEFREIFAGDGGSQIVDVTAPPKLIRRGVLSVNEEPIYIVEMAEEQDGTSMITTYAVKKDSKPPIKDFTKTETRYSYKESTKLGKMANNLLKAQKKQIGQTQIEEKPPLFMTPVVTGMGTFTGKLERGFYERERDQFVQRNGKAYIEYGSNTGVFIGLDSIKWEKAFVNAGDLVNNYVQNKLIWFDLNHRNEFQFKSDYDLALEVHDDGF